MNLTSVTMAWISVKAAACLALLPGTFCKTRLARIESDSQSKVCQIVSVTNGAKGCASVKTASSTYVNSALFGAAFTR